MAYQPIPKPTWSGKSVPPRYYPRPGTGYQGHRSLIQLSDTPYEPAYENVLRQALSNMSNKK